jgi:hypothetical protein
MSAPLAADHEEIGRFVTTIFPHADGYVHLRTFEHERGKPPVEIKAVRINGEGLEPIIAQATGAANRAARHLKPTVFAPIPATFKDGGKAELANVFNGLALFVDVDEANPRMARERLEGLLGPAGAVVASGGTWTDPATGEVQDKIHIYWPLSEPTRTPEEHARLNRAIRIATALVGGDPSMTLVHPLRWPGSWNRKGEPKLARGRYADAKVHLDDALDKLEQAATLALEHATGEEADRLRRALELRDGTREGTFEHDPDARDPDLETLADAIPNDDAPRAEYVAVGLAYHAASDGSAAGFNAWDRWARKSKKYHGGTAAQWEHFFKSPPNRTGKGALVERARRHDPAFRLPSWGPEREEEREQEQASQPDIGTDEPSEQNSDEIEKIVAEAPAGIGRMVRWMVRTAVSPQSWLSLGAALCCYATVAGRRYFIETPDTRPVLFVTAVAGSGSGKDHPRQCVKRALNEAGLAEHLGGETFASGSSVITAMSACPSRLFPMDEIGQHIKAMLDPRNVSPHRREIMTQLTTFWSSGGGVVTGIEYANAKERPRLDVVQPSLCVYGSTVPETLWEGLQGGNMSDGSLARFLILASPSNYPDRQTPEPISEKLGAVAAELKAVALGAAGWNYPDLGFGAAINPNPYPVPFTEAARAYDADLDRRQLEMLRQHEGTQFDAIVARFREQTMRVALVAAVADCPAAPVLDAKHLEWAERVVKVSVDTLKDQATRFLADSKYEQDLKGLLDLIRKRCRKDPKRWITGNELANAARRFPPKQRAEMLTDLEEMEEIEVRTEGGGGTGKKASLFVRVRRR